MGYIRIRWIFWVSFLILNARCSADSERKKPSEEPQGLGHFQLEPQNPTTQKERSGDAESRESSQDQLPTPLRVGVLNIEPKLPTFQKSSGELRLGAADDCLFEDDSSQVTALQGFCKQGFQEFLGLSSGAIACQVRIGESVHAGTSKEACQVLMDELPAAKAE